MLKATPDGLRIIGKQPIGVLYGAYEILKAYGGIRKITPGEDGEYFTVKPPIAMPRQDSMHNPSCRWRILHFGGCSVDCVTIHSWNWIVRNNIDTFLSAKMKSADQFLLINDDGPGWSPVSRMALACVENTTVS